MGSEAPEKTPSSVGTWCSERGGVGAQGILLRKDVCLGVGSCQTVAVVWGLLGLRGDSKGGLGAAGFLS